MINLLLYPISLIPLRILYVISDVFAYLLYHVFKYRRKVVKANIDRSFHYLDETERLAIEKRFYKNFCDHFIETLKLLTMTEQELRQHITADYSELEKILATNQSCHVYLGHQFNWEWANAHVASAFKNTNVVVAYKPISSKSFNNLMLKIRSRFGSKMVSSMNMKKEMEAYADKQHVLVLVADQNPNKPMKSFWTSFLSQPTAFISGTELYTASHKTPLLFAEIIREERGHYKFVLTPVFDFTQQYKTGILTAIFTEKLEDTIKSHPENYLWSHKRWKHIYKNEYSKRFFDKSIMAH
ncbi:lysophospholipid acyltransferase family protein [Flavobacterium sangjuense]|uniref:Lipid A biosynthesis lauroyltransferase n=1 Tax=Flavobacterium sangjuense TaxID=2518177 RepID=A0A4P7PUU2_9FLAO|nr:lysophospholipid acyltransferase family protein [Flavobacterium sangjuense]QBZ98526.1 Lipid A biosynthesis lauroyltransferase [Flavobacterium sangjuense]